MPGLVNLIPGVGELVMPVQSAASTTRAVVGEAAYQGLRGTTTWAGSAAAGFLPVMPIFWPLQIGLFVITILVLVYVFHVPGRRAAIYAYVVQGLVVMICAHWAADKFMDIGLGI